jgi:hypothetical protein
MNDAEAGTRIAALAAELCLNFAVALAGMGALPAESKAAIAGLLRDLARLYEGLDNFESASGYWSGAKLVEAGVPLLAAERRMLPERDPQQLTSH